MMQALKKFIFGVPQGSDTHAAKRLAQPLACYLPESQVPANGVESVAQDGSTWIEWRVDHNSGQKWYRRTSSASESQPSILAIAQSDSPQDDDTEELEVVDEFAEQESSMAEMFAKHIMRARERAINNPVPEFKPYEPYKPDTTEENENENDDDE